MAPVFIHGGPKKWVTHSLPQFCQILTDFQIFFTGKFGVNWLLKMLQLRAYVDTLPCKTLMS